AARSGALNLMAQGEEAGVGGDQPRRQAELLLVYVDRRDQQVGVAGPFVVNLVMRDDLLFGLLDPHHLVELDGLGGLALADDLGVGLEQADELAWRVRVALESRCLVWRMTCCTRGIIVWR